MTTDEDQGEEQGEDLLSQKTLLDSLNGFDEIAICRAFGMDFNELSQTGLLSMRALLFIHLRREGAKDADAFKVVMNMTMKEIMARFKKGEREEGGDPEKEQEPISLSAGRHSLLEAD